MITIRFWGVRGSVAAAGEHTARVGGNTSCVEVQAGGERLVFDAGTGLRALGNELVRAGGPCRVHLLLSHFHWDHIQGFPFFTPAYVAGNEVRVYGPERAAPGGDVRAALAAQMRPPHFPVGLDALRARLLFRALPAGTSLDVGGVTVRTAAASHPNGCLAYRVEADGCSVVYATDTEHDPAATEPDRGLTELARGADLLIYDAQYTEDEYHGRVGPGRRGWGHSTASEGVRLARAAGVGQLVLFHHDPSRDDDAVAGIERETQARFSRTVAAREGLVIHLDATARAA
jgi:phosphoribosyl 1,2-cyclic phosphodiesterase